MLFSWILLVIGVFAVSRAFLRLKDKTITFGSCILWILVWACAVVLSFMPELTTDLANLLGVKRGVDIVVFISIIALFYLVFRIYVRIENLNKKLSELVERLALRK